MPRDSYCQDSGNPTQQGLLPSESLSLQFSRPLDRQKCDALLKNTLKNLLLMSFYCHCADWFVHAFEFGFPWNILLLAVIAFMGVKVWEALGEKPSKYLVFIPVAIHILAGSSFLEALITSILAAYVGKEFTRHYVYIALTKTGSFKETEASRFKWDSISLISGLATVPLVLPFADLRLLIFGPVVWAVALIFLLVATDQATLFSQIRSGWSSWFTYNAEDQFVAGIVDSPVGSVRYRCSLVIVLVCSICLTMNSAFPISSFFWDGMMVNAGLVGAVVCYSIGLLSVGFPVLLCCLLTTVAAWPAFRCFPFPIDTIESSHDWGQIVHAISQSDNRVERESLFFGRLTADGSPFLVPRKVFKEHAHILGDSGSGKTARGLLPLIEQLVADGKSSLMVIDLKGDSQEILASLNHSAEKHGGTDSKIPVRQFTVREDQATFAFNPFQLPCWKQLGDFQRTDVLCGALGLIYGTDYGRGYYSSANASLLHKTLKAYPDIGSFGELSDRISFVTSRPRAHGLSDKQAEAGNHIKMVCERLASFKALNVTPDLTPDRLVAEQMMDPSRLFTQQEIFYYHLSTTLGPGSSPEIARLAMFMLLTTATLSETRRQVYLVIDEFQRVAAHNVDVILQIARSMNVGVILVNQSMSDLKRDNLVHVVESNCRFRQWFAISSSDEQVKLSKSSGETMDVLISESRSQHKDGFNISHTSTRSANQIITPRLSINDIKLASDAADKSIALVTRGAGYCQYGGMPVVIQSDFHISEKEFLKRKNSAWPKPGDGAFVPACWSILSEPADSRRTKKGPTVTEETIGEPPDLFESFFSDQQS